MKDKISSLQIGSIMWNLMLSSYIGIVPYIIFFKLKQDSWLAILFDFIIGILVILLYLYIWGKMPEKNIFEKIEIVFGKIIGKIISFILTLTVIYMTITYFYSMISFIGSQYLAKTPDLFIILIFCVPIVYLITQKLQVIGRVIFIFWLISIVLFGLTFLGLSFQLDFSRLFPIFENGALAITKGGLLCLPYTHFSLLLLLAIPKNSIIDKEKLNKRIFIFYLFIFLAIFSGAIIITTTLGGELAKIYQFVEYQALKRVTLIGFIERIESTLSMRWILYMFTTATIGLYFVKNYNRHTFKFKNKENVVIAIISIILLIISKWIFPNNTLGNEIIMNVIPYFLYIFYLLLPIIIAIGLKFKKQTN